MSTQFDGPRQRGQEPETPLAQLPDWGLDIMRGLYGPDTIDAECARQRRTRTHLAGADSIETDDPVRPLSPLEAELVAADALGALVLRFLRRR
ncbi:hypothetical protein GOPIP_004_01350 [Gordonia polyisoprenivorans NBRC 16320 = JCM 10675]|uniref:Uncharacterized protein n=1 Tax=Gordonia polyisoprenivorans TaxID=84595 RepID=A0A846WSB0_9ACTN|nr:hypothetical protein [Gordonia polyisoprenivorans]NKY03836.1 hypothetical protein [Gordonia polyisoprenivorans]UZF54630.1 hypothetical protein LH935_18025 [Gordonia polyisoprenivorans]GAB21170.1 hypothetical protein GOPIP_004_01350 [Gordonia polyisoprenivorans NBRC 16320 = JCM 10675]